MKYRQNNTIEVAAAKASISRATAYRIENDPRLPSQRGCRASGVVPIHLSISSMPKLFRF